MPGVICIFCKFLPKRGFDSHRLHQTFARYGGRKNLYFSAVSSIVRDRIRQRIDEERAENAIRAVCPGRANEVFNVARQAARDGEFGSYTLALRALYRILAEHGCESHERQYHS